MQFPFGPLVDPFADQLNLLRSQGPVGIGRRHSEASILGADPLVKPAVSALARKDYLVAATVSEDTFFSIQPELGLAALLVRPMTSEAVVGKNGADFPVEIQVSTAGQGCRA